MSKKILLLCLLVAGMFCCIPTIVKAEISEDGEWEYEVDGIDEETGQFCVMVTDYLGNETDVTIPNTIDGYIVYQVQPRSLDTVTMQGINPFEGIVTLTISDGIEQLGQYAFTYCKTLENIKIPATVTVINNSFHKCNNLINIEVNSDNANYASYDGALYNKEKTTLIKCPEGKEEISLLEGTTDIGNAFSNCEKIGRIEIPSGVITINDSAFEYCKSLTEIVIPDTVVDIGREAFSGCVELESIKIPDGVTVIKEQTFFNCDSLISINIPESVTCIDYASFLSCDGLTEVKIPSSVTSIGPLAFSNCYSLVNIDIPNSVTSIGGAAFSDNPNLVSIKLPNNLPKIEMGMFASCSKLSYVEIPQSVKEIYDADVFYASDLVVIYGYTGSYAESFATENNIPFVALDELTDEQTKDVVCEGNTETAINTDEDKLLEMIFTEDELKMIDNGSDVYIKLEVNDVTANVSNADKNTIQNALPNGYNVEKYFDITLWSKLEDVDAQITETNGMVEIAITISLEEAGTYKVIRVHNGKAEILPSEIKDGKLVFSTDKFSTYAIIHSEAPVDVDTGNNLRNEALILTTIVVLTAVIGSCYYKKKKIV